MSHRLKIGSFGTTVEILPCANPISYLLIFTFCNNSNSLYTYAHTHRNIKKHTHTHAHTHTHTHMYTHSHTHELILKIFKELYVYKRSEILLDKQILYLCSCFFIYAFLTIYFIIWLSLPVMFITPNSYMYCNLALEVN